MIKFNNFLKKNNKFFGSHKIKNNLNFNKFNIISKKKQKNYLKKKIKSIKTLFLKKYFKYNRIEKKKIKKKNRDTLNFILKYKKEKWKKKIKKIRFKKINNNYTFLKKKNKFNNKQIYLKRKELNLLLLYSFFYDFITKEKAYKKLLAFIKKIPFIFSSIKKKKYTLIKKKNIGLLTILNYSTNKVSKKNKIILMKQLILFLCGYKIKQQKFFFKYKKPYLKKKIKYNKYKYNYLNEKTINNLFIQLKKKKLFKINNIFNRINYFSKKKYIKFLKLQNRNKYFLKQNQLIKALVLLINITINNIVKKRYQFYITERIFVTKLKKIYYNVYKKNKNLFFKQLNNLKLYDTYKNKNYLINLKKWRKQVKQNILYGKKYFMPTKFNKSNFLSKKKKFIISNRMIKKIKLKRNKVATLYQYKNNISFYKKKILLIQNIKKNQNKKLYKLNILKKVILYNYKFINFINNNDYKKINNQVLLKWNKQIKCLIKPKLPIYNINKTNIVKLYIDNIIKNYNNIYNNMNKYKKYNSIYQLNEIKILKKKLIKIHLFLLKLNNKNNIFKWKIEKNEWIKNKIKKYILLKKKIWFFFISQSLINKNINNYSNYIICKIINIKLKKLLFREIKYFLSTQLNINRNLINLCKKKTQYIGIKKLSNKQNKGQSNVISYNRGLFKKKQLLNIIYSNKFIMNNKYKIKQQNILFRYVNTYILSKQQQVNSHYINSYLYNTNALILNSFNNNINIFLSNTIYTNKKILNILFHETYGNARYLIQDNNKILHSRSVGSLGLTKEEKKMKRWRKKLGEYVTYWVYKVLNIKKEKYDYLYLYTIGKRRIIKFLFFKLRSYLKRKSFRIKFTLKKKKNYWKKIFIFSKKSKK